MNHVRLGMKKIQGQQQSVHHWLKERFGNLTPSHSSNITQGDAQWVMHKTRVRSDFAGNFEGFAHSPHEHCSCMAGLGKVQSFQHLRLVQRLAVACHVHLQGDIFVRAEIHKMPSLCKLSELWHDGAGNIVREIAAQPRRRDRAVTKLSEDLVS